VHGLGEVLDADAGLLGERGSEEKKIGQGVEVALLEAGANGLILAPGLDRTEGRRVDWTGGESGAEKHTG